MLTLDAPSVTLEGVELTWNVSRANARILHFAVHRSPAGADRWELLKDPVAESARSFRDRTFYPGTDTSYRVTCYFTDQPAGVPARGSRIGKTVAIASTAQSRGKFEVSFFNAMKGMAYVTITKIDASGIRIQLKHIHHAGDRIGWWTEAGGSEPRSWHRVALRGGRSALVDFDTGLILKSVEPRKVRITVKRCVPGRKECRIVEETVSVETVEVVTVNRTGGERKVARLDPRRNARTQDRLCERHRAGGRSK